jgi:hypothetical protein
MGAGRKATARHGERAFARSEVPTSAWTVAATILGLPSNIAAAVTAAWRRASSGRSSACDLEPDKGL